MKEKSNKKIRAIRAKAVEYAVKNLDWPADMKFTCDGCPAAKKCSWVYDLYNTDGDCLALK